jgi:hypothetical protein
VFPVVEETDSGSETLSQALASPLIYAIVAWVVSSDQGPALGGALCHSVSLASNSNFPLPPHFPDVVIDILICRRLESSGRRENCVASEILPLRWAYIVVTD